MMMMMMITSDLMSFNFGALPNFFTLQGRDKGESRRDGRKGLTRCFGGGAH